MTALSPRLSPETPRQRHRMPSPDVQPLHPVTGPAEVRHDAMAEVVERIAPPDLHVRFPWRDLDAIYGPLLPGSVHIVSARTGSGKTLFVLNWLWSLIAPTPHTPVAYFPLETPAKEVVIRLACHSVNVHPADVLRGDFSAVPGGREGFTKAVGIVTEALLKPRIYPGTLEMAPRLFLYDEPTISVPALRLAVLDAAERGCRVVIVDHLLRLDLGDQTNLYAQVSVAIRQLKMLAEEAGVVMIVTSQQSRATGGTKLAWYAAPDLQALKGAGTIEEEADGVLFLHRVLRDDITEKDRRAVEAGLTPLQDIVAAHLMGCAIGKHRLDGGQVGAACRLYVENGLVADLPDHIRRDWQAAQHAIRTASRV